MLLLVGLLGATLLPAPVGASGTADVAVVLALIDDAAEPQRVRATVTNQGPQPSAHPILELDAGDGAAVSAHTGDPQPGSLADGVACASRPEGFSCQWEELAAGAQVAVDIELSVAAATTVTARLEAAGTPDPNPDGNNLATLALSPATTDLAVEVRAHAGRPHRDAGGDRHERGGTAGLCVGWASCPAPRSRRPGATPTAPAPAARWRRWPPVRPPASRP